MKKRLTKNIGEEKHVPFSLKKREQLVREAQAQLEKEAKQANELENERKRKQQLLSEMYEVRNQKKIKD